MPLLPNRTIRVMLLDDHAFILQGMSMTLATAPDIRILGAFTDVRDLNAALKVDEPDVLILDFCLRPGEVDGVNLIRGLQIRHPGVRLLVVSSLHTPSTVALAMRTGARGFMGKELGSEQLETAIRQVVAGEQYLSAAMARRLADAEVAVMHPLQAPPDDLRRPLAFASLTNREHEVLRCCLDGLSVTQIAEKFSRSVKTISAQKQSAFRKLGLRSNHELFNQRSQFEGWQ